MKKKIMSQFFIHFILFFFILHKIWIEIDLKKWKRVSLLSNVVMKTEKYYWVLILVKIRIEQLFSKWAKICISWTYKPTSLITLIVDKVNNQYECRWWEEKHCIPWTTEFTWMEDSFKKFQNATFFEIFEIPTIG